MRVLLLTPMSREARALGAEVCGTGAAAGAHVERRLAGGGYDAVVLAGVCGGMDPSLGAGSVVLARRVLSATAAPLEPRPELLEEMRTRLRARRVPFVAASLLTVDRPLATPSARTDAWNTHGAAGVDMETYAVAAAAERAGLPWIALRTVLDPAGSSLPDSLANWSNDGDERAIIRAALRRPLEWPAYVRLALQMRSAMASLKRAAPIVVRACELLEANADAAAPVRSRTVEPIALV